MSTIITHRQFLHPSFEIQHPAAIRLLHPVCSFSKNLKKRCAAVFDFSLDQFQNMADASERQGADDREVRKIMEQCISLYLNEKERNKLYHWKDILEEPAYREYFRTKTFVESWYHFLDTHRMFDAAIWQYFQWIDGKLFSALEADVMPFAYPTQEEIERMPRQETPEQTQERRTPEPGPALPKVKKEKSKAVKVLLYLAALAGTGIGGMILGIIAGTILG